MLKTPTWENLFKFPHDSNFESFEFYADSTFHRVFTFEPKSKCSKSFETGGAQLIVQDPDGPKMYHSNLLEPSYFSDWIQNRNSTQVPRIFNRCSETTAKTWDRAQEIEQTSRRILLDLGNLIDFKAKYAEANKTFTFASTKSGVHQGEEKLASFSVEFSAKKGERVRRFKIERGRTDLNSLSSDLEKSFMNREQLEKALQQPWPAPKGRVNIAWSPSSVAKLLLCLIQQLEYSSQNSDAFASLSQAFGQCSFQVIDNWKQGSRVDVEGRLRKETLLIDSLGTLNPFNEQIPGFSRRNSSRDYPITAPWEPALFGRERDSKLLVHLGNGISIHEVEVLAFHPSSGLICLEITQAALVHQGIEGEYIEPVQWELPLVDLFSSFKLFSDSSHPHPLHWSRYGQRLFVEVTTPQALSPSLEFPGTVPLSYYW